MAWVVHFLPPQARLELSERVLKKFCPKGGEAELHRLPGPPFVPAELRSRERPTYSILTTPTPAAVSTSHPLFLNLLHRHQVECCSLLGAMVPISQKTDSILFCKEWTSNKLWNTMGLLNANDKKMRITIRSVQWLPSVMRISFLTIKVWRWIQPRQSATMHHQYLGGQTHIAFVICNVPHCRLSLPTTLQS